MKTLFFLAPGMARTALMALALLHGVASATNLADQPVFATSEVPGNLALALSVEWPTASRTAHVDNYSSATNFLGYYDPAKCYTYITNTAANSTNTGDTSYFTPAGAATNRACTGVMAGKWSGNFLNWAATATIDPFRWAMTGGRRVVDTVSETILEKGWHSGQGLFNDRDLTVSEIAGATPFNTATRVNVSVNGRGYKMRLAVDGASTSRNFSATYYNNNTLSGQAVATVTNDSAYHDWGTNSPAAGVTVDNFSARFRSTFTVPTTGTYYFQSISDDGIRVWVDTSGTNTFTNGTRAIDNWTDHGSVTDTTGAYNLTAGQSISVQVEYYEASGGAVMQLLWQKPGTSTYTAVTSDSQTNDYTMRVKVCDPSLGVGLLEANCKRYGDNYKPEGLIQQYAEKMRFSAFGYLNQSGNDRDGGVMRARQKFVAPMQPVPGQPSIVNTKTEWSGTTGVFIDNPDSADAAATNTAFGLPANTISHSGVMNYLNLFGQLKPGNYKNNDPVSELYYATLRYYKNLGNVASWTNMENTDNNTKITYLDGFPAITNWDDPIQHSCQRNFVLGIGDIYTHADKNVPGNTNTNTEPTLPAEVVADTTVNAVTATNRLGVLQGMGNDYGTRTNVSNGCCSNNSGLMAGLAFDANTKDIRPDVSSIKKTVGKQTVQTYWVDVLEQSFQKNNQFYLAAKFGGLDPKKLPTDFDPYTFAGTIPLDWWSTTGETLRDTRLSATDGTQARPDNYFAAGRPDTMLTGLTKAFAAIANAIKAFTTSFSLSTVRVSAAGAASYASQYDSNGWTGEVTASTITFNTSGDPNSAVVWSSATKLEAQLGTAGWDTARRVVTWNGSAGSPFRYDSLTSRSAALTPPYGVDAGSTFERYVAYLRGDRTYERTATDSSKPYRARKYRLGDIVNAKVTPVAPPALTFSDTPNPGYAAFKATWQNRPTMVYVGANDGMLHAFDGSLTGANAGLERFAYVPSFLFANGLLAELGNPDYDHKYYVDATPLAFDIDMNNAGGTFTSTNAATSNWKTVLIGGLGKGGKGFYAIDVTDPANMTSEATVASKVLWEFSDADMGYSFGAPTVVKTKKYGWVVIFTGGYFDNGTSPTSAGHLYIVNPRNGALLEKIATPSDSEGLAQVTAYVADFTDGTTDAVYGGDLNGQVWRFDLTQARGTSTAYPAPVKIGTLNSTLGAAQPVTTQPLVEVQPLSKRRFVLIGTGKLLAAADIQSTAEQSFYAIIDGTASAFGGTLPAGASYPLTRANLTRITDLTEGASLTDTSLGWYIDLGVDTEAGGVAWRVVNNLTGYAGIVAFSSLQTTGDACSPSGQSRIYAIDFGKGKSVLSDNSAFQLNQSAITDLKFLSVDGTVRLVAGDVTGAIKKIGITLPGAQGLRVLNWREIPTAD